MPKKTPATSAQKAAKFKELAEIRANRALRAIVGLSKLANPAKYAYTPDQIKTLENAFKEHLSACFAAFEGKKTISEGIKL